MLKKSEKITIEGKSILDGVELAGFVASIDSNDPTQMNISSWQINKAAYKANRSVARADEAEFEDYAYDIQDEMIAKAAETAPVPETPNV